MRKNATSSPAAREAAEAAAPAVRELRGNAVTLHKGELENSLRLAQLVGANRAFRLNMEANRVAMLQSFARIKQGKAYENSQVLTPNGEVITARTWAQFCEALGFCVRTIDEDLKFLSVFGANVLEHQAELGLGRSDLRAIARGVADMSDAEQAALREELDAAEGNEALEAAVDRLQTQVRDLKADLRAKDRVLEKKSDELNALQTEMERRKAKEGAMGQELLDAACNAAVLAVADMCARFADLLPQAGDDDADYARRKMGLAVSRMADSLLQPAVDIDLGEYLSLPVAALEQD